LKKIVSLLLIFLFLFQSISVYAETFVNNNVLPTNNNNFEEISYSENDSGYKTYQVRNSSLSNSSESITLDYQNVFESNVATIAQSGILLENVGDYVELELSVKESAWFCPKINYVAIEGYGGDIEASLLIDGNIPYAEMENFTLPRMWKNSTGTFHKNTNGNEFSPEQAEAFVEQSNNIFDSDGFIISPLNVALSSGKHIIRIELLSEKIKINSIVLEKPEKIKSYKEYIEEYSNVNEYSGEKITIEGEKAALKSSKMYIPLSNRNEASLSPSSPYRQVINYIGGSNWNSHGGTIKWNLSVKRDGLYRVDFHFHQTYLQEGVSYRTLKLDDEIPFQEAQSVPFKYGTGWQYMSLQTADENPMLLYLEKGKHTLSLSVTLGEMADFALQLKSITTKLGKIYRSIVKITGESPDANRDYNLFSSIPTLETDLSEISKTLKELSKYSENISGTKGGSNSQILDKADLILNQMLIKKYKAHTKLRAFYDNYSSLCSWLYEMQNMALDIDTISFSSPKEDSNDGCGFFKTFAFSLMRLISSFTEDYNSVNTTDNSKEITLWSNWGRDQLNIIENLIDNDFTPNTGIKVNLKITDATLVQAGLSGNGPDIEINSARTNPLNYGMRGILTDLSKFDDYQDVIKRFRTTALVPYEYNGGIYGLPDTEIFEMLFIRTDIFQELDLQIPKTWDEFINCAKVISINNMNSGMGADISIFLTQMNVDLYKKDKSATNLMSTGAVKATKYWLDFYTKYDFPVSYSFFNRFRTGLMPMAIASFSEYATIKAAAPEINGLWTVVAMPGFKDENGNINNKVTGAGTASMILNWSKNKESAWEFLKWWTSDDIQYRFAVNCESVLGVSGRYPTANINALYKLSWDKTTLKSLKEVEKNIYQLPEVPGSYYVSRSINQVKWNVINNGENVEDMLDRWIPEADNEIQLKTEEYSN